MGGVPAKRTAADDKASALRLVSVLRALVRDLGSTDRAVQEAASREVRAIERAIYLEGSEPSTSAGLLEKQRAMLDALDRAWSLARLQVPALRRVRRKVTDADERARLQSLRADGRKLKPIVHLESWEEHNNPTERQRKQREDAAVMLAGALLGESCLVVADQDVLRAAVLAWPDRRHGKALALDNLAMALGCYSATLHGNARKRRERRSLKA
jgi:hypothetical protein